MRVVLLNGPARVGKDSAGRALLRAFDGAEAVKFAGALKAGTHALFGLRGATPGTFETVKDEPRAEFFGLTPRQAYIAVSEGAVKPAFGLDFFGKVLAARLGGLRGCRLAVVTDSGFEGEAVPVIEAFGAANTLLIRLHRRGHTFAGDSRAYLTLPGVATRDVTNDGAERDMHAAVVEVVTRWLG